MEARAAGAFRHLDGLFVEVTSSLGVEDEDGTPGLKGERGRVIGWSEDQEQYLVQTFSGYQAFVPEEGLSEFLPEDPELPGGFDVAWPWGPTAHSLFASMVGEKIKEKGFCVIQMFLPMEGEEQAPAESLASFLSWGIMRGELEEEYLGQDVVDGKLAWCEPPEEEGQAPGMRLYDVESLGADMRMEYLTDNLERCDRALTNLAALLWPVTPEFEEDRAFHTWGRTSGLVRTGLAAGEPDGSRKNILGPDSSDDFQRHLTFCDRRRLCMLYLADNEGGELSLIPNSEAYDYSEVSIPLSKNKIVVFRCDSMGLGYSYRPEGRNLSLTSWVLDTPTELLEEEEALRVISGPEEPMGQRTNVMSAHTRYPGNGFEAAAYWNMLAFGTDTQVQVPISRWEIDIYYRKEHTQGYSMTCHGAMLTESEITEFDNKFFRIPEEEAKIMAPDQRCVLEVGYEALHRAGHRAEEMLGWKCGVFVGDTGSDWLALCCTNQTRENMRLVLAGRERSMVCTRLSHVMGLRGPCATSETACSSSLVACGLAQGSLRERLSDQSQLGVSTDLRHALVIGTNTLLGPNSYISLSGPGMLTSKGRCFTFDASADGYARGEGIGAVKLKACRDSSESLNRLAMLIGCSVNQDGRSATMTAPHGPSQQEVIRNSMREAWLTPDMITVAECHGTGTALGDPIEVGALRSVLGEARSKPILKTSAKTNIGHLEAAAGVAGLVKCVLLLGYSTCLPNAHLGVLNPHLDVEDFPVYFATEGQDYGANSGLTGVSSFGFGGTNARADVWGHAQHGHRFCITGMVPRSHSIVV